MESFESLLYLAAKQRIKDLVPEIKHIDLDHGQLENYGDRPAVAFPCVLIDFPETAFENLAGLVQNAAPMLEMRLGFAPFSSTGGGTPTLQVEKGLGYFELEQKLYLAFQGWAPIFEGDEPACQPFIRVRKGTEKRNDAIRVRVNQFSTWYMDDTAQEEAIKAEADIQLTPN